MCPQERSYWRSNKLARHYRWSDLRRNQNSRTRIRGVGMNVAHQPISKVRKPDTGSGRSAWACRWPKQWLSLKAVGEKAKSPMILGRSGRLTSFTEDKSARSAADNAVLIIAGRAPLTDPANGLSRKCRHECLNSGQCLWMKIAGLDDVECSRVARSNSTAAHTVAWSETCQTTALRLTFHMQ
jgi:hypothetical protein